ncbi:MAG: alkaline phosphatase [Rubripirellula sp.]
MSGEVTSNSVLLQTRLTSTKVLDEDLDLPGIDGVVIFEWADNRDFNASQRTPSKDAMDEHDFIVRHELTGLRAGTTYFYRALHGFDEDNLQVGATCSFKTLPGAGSAETVRFVMGSCINYNKFMHGKAGNASGPETATEEDKRLGFPSFATMKEFDPDFFIGTGDIVYYDNKINNASRVNELRQCWHEQFRFPRMIEFFANVPGYWSKDDHDFRFNDSDNAGDRAPSPKTGIDLFREQMPILAMHDRKSPTYRTHRINEHVQLWFTEGRDYRSANRSQDGPDKTLWGPGQFKWLKRTLKDSDAKWKIMITPTPMVGPDLAKKTDNHTNLGGFQHEANEFFTWLDEAGIELLTFCGDRHWQYHSIHPSGVEEFACGTLNDENSRMGVVPGSIKGTDPKGLIKQPYTYSEPRGGFLFVEAAATLAIRFHDTRGNLQYAVKK